MAHAGTMGLGQTTKAARGGNPWLVVAVMVAIVVATLAVWFATGSGLKTGATGRPAAEERIEMLRIAAGRGPLIGDGPNAIKNLSGSNAVRGPLPDDSYNAIEDLSGSNAVRGPLPDDSYNAIKDLSGSNAVRGPLPDDSYNAIAPALVPGRFDGYDQAEKIRGSGAVAAAAGKSSVVVGPGDYTFAQLQQMGAVKPSTTSFAGNPAAAILPGSVVSGGSGVIVPGPYSYLQLQQMHITAITPAISATSGTFHVGRPAAVDPIVLLPGITTIDNPVKRDRVGGQ